MVYLLYTCKISSVCIILVYVDLIEKKVVYNTVYTGIQNCSKSQNFIVKAIKQESRSMGQGQTSNV